MKPIDYSKLAPTKDYLQDIAKVIGKTQQLFLPSDSRDWQKGLLVSDKSLTSQVFELDGSKTQIVLDMHNGQVDASDRSWPLTITAQDLLADFRKWLNKDVAEPELVTDRPSFDEQQALQLANALLWAQTQLEQLKASIKTGITSPVLLFPHHFDVSLVWYPKDDEKQLTYGFSPGDNSVGEPYFYVTAWPEPQSFTKINLPELAHWQTKDFSGAIITYNALVTQLNPGDVLSNFFQTIGDVF